MRLTEEQHRQVIAAGLSRLEDAEASLATAKHELAEAVWAAKRDGVKHNTVADWFNMTRDGLTKFLQRNSR